MTNNITIVPSNLTSKFNPKIDQNILLSLDQKQQEMVETDRSSTINLAQVYDDERQRSTIFRPTNKLTFIFKNVYTGTTPYDQFENQLYYINEENSLTNCLPDWPGYPQYQEFDFIRIDNKVSGYTIDSGSTVPAHVYFKTKSASSYNWSIYLSYPHKNLEDVRLEHWTNKTILDIQWVAKEGIPFKIQNTTFNGRSVISFICFANHGLTVGEAVKLNFLYNGSDTFLVDSLGNETVGSSEYIFNIDNIGYPPNVFTNNKVGTFRRILDPNNPDETICKYYVREHKILTEETDTILEKSGFELNIFNTDQKIEYSVLTPNKTQRVSVKEGNQSYTISFKKDVDINGLLDNQKRPLTQLFTTIINKGYFGWFNNPFGGNNALKFGFEMNLTDTSNGWWSNTNTKSLETNIRTGNYNSNGRTFFYNLSLSTGDTIYGDFCEWNDYNQTERVISGLIHKIRFNPDNFLIEPTPSVNPDGYYYKVHHPTQIREFSTYIETATNQEITAAPNYSFYCKREENFRWRDIYTYGFIDETGVGVDYPFLNGAHYPYRELIFRLFPEGYFEYQKRFQIITQPITDDCGQI